MKRVLTIARVPFAASVRRIHGSCVRHGTVDKSSRFVVCGAGAGGLAVAARLGRKFGEGNVIIVDPSENHYYQPMWTLVGAGIKTLAQSCRPMESLIPPQAKWINNAVTEFHPEENFIVIKDGTKIGYEFLVVAMGLQVNYDKIKGLPEALAASDSNVSSNYSATSVEKTFQNMQQFTGGNATFTFPPMPIKCPGAPQKIMYLADDYWRKQGVRDNATIMYNTALGVIFGVKKYADELLKVVDRKGIQLNFKRNLIEVDAVNRQAIFEVLEENRTETFPFDFMHVTPPMGPLDVMKGQAVSDPGGWVDVDKNTLRHNKYGNVFGIGDCTSIPTSRTAAACAAESAVLTKNLLAVIRGESLPSNYDGYTSCPLITGFGKTILAEFDFNAQPLETFPFDQGKERASMYYLKTELLPVVYWEGLLRGVWGGPEPFRKAMSSLSSSQDK